MYAQHRHWSPEPEQVTGIQAKSFRHDPYRSPIGKLFYYPDESHATPAPQQYSAGIDYSSMPMQTAELPHGTRHTELWGRVSFVPYPTTEFYTPAEALPQDPNSLVRVFLGQLPYFVTDMQLSWLCYTFGGFNVVAYPERIMKRQPNGERLPTGCIHAYASEHAIEEMAAGMHKRMLVDDTGVWHAQSDEELQALTTYIASMKSDKTKRVPGRPYDTVVVQMATSTFVPLCPMPLSEFPSEYRVKPQRVSPPPYEAAVNQLPPPYHV